MGEAMTKALDKLADHLRWLGHAGAIGILDRADAQKALHDLQTLRLYLRPFTSPDGVIRVSPAAEIEMQRAAQAAEIAKLRKALGFYAKPWHRTVARKSLSITGQTIGTRSGYIEITATRGRVIPKDSPLLVQARVARVALGLPELFGSDEVREATDADSP